ncbi:MAG: HdeA/HdeB family chaperone [Alphaproteobacteria bacterium]
MTERSTRAWAGMRRSGPLAIAALAIVAGAGAAQAQSILDYVRMDCTRFAELPLETQIGVLFWIDGYQSRTSGDLELNFIEIAYAIRNFEDSCASQPRATLGRFLDVRF